MRSKKYEYPANRAHEIMRQSGKLERRPMEKKRISANRKQPQTASRNNRKK
jgi:hypothetical protein